MHSVRHTLPGGTPNSRAGIDSKIVGGKASSLPPIELTPDPMEQGTALEALRGATQHWHQRLESSLAIAHPGAGTTEYLHYLQDLWGWLRPFHAALWDAEWPAELDAPMRGGKLAAIEADLRAAGFAGADIAALPLADFRPDLASPAARFGVAYVIEGAQLGVRVLAKTLAPQLDGWTPQWLQGYGARNGSSWKTFIACAERQLAAPTARETAAKAAEQAFASLAAWFARRAQERREPHGTPTTGAQPTVERTL